MTSNDLIRFTLFWLAMISTINAFESETNLIEDNINENATNQVKYSIIFIRHGQSEWNLKRLFTGWYDSQLTDKGICQAIAAGEFLKSSNIHFDIAYTSLLSRAIETTKTILQIIEPESIIPIEYSWLLNERHYGALTGLYKDKTKYNEVPTMFKDHPYYDEIHQNKRYDNLFEENQFPNGESFQATEKRFVSYWKSTLLPELKLDKKMLIVTHGNLLRGAIKYFENLSEEEALKLTVKNGMPFIYEFDSDLKTLAKMRYLY